MSAPVDVLAVMDEAADLLAGCPDPQVAEESERDLRQARAAVAELVEAAKEHHLQASRVQAEKPGSYEREQAEDRLHGHCYFRLRAALAKFGGAA